MARSSSSERRRRRQAPELAERTLRAARDLFVECGYEATTVRQIAQRAGCSPGMLYYLHGNKEQLLARLVERTFAKLEERLARCAQGAGEPLQRLRNALAAYIDLALEHPHEYEFLFRQGRNPPSPAVRELFRSRGMPSYQWLVRLCEECRRAGLLDERAGNAEETAQALLFAAHGLAHFMNSARDFPFLDRERLIERHLDLLLTGIRRHGCREKS